MAIDYELSEQRQLQRFLLDRQYFGLVQEDYANTPHQDFLVGLSPTSAFPVEAKHEYYRGTNLCIELVANIPSNLAHKPLGIPFAYSKEDQTVIDSFIAQAKDNHDNARKGIAYGLATAPLFPTHVTQYVRAIPDSNPFLDNPSATLYYFQTIRLQQSIEVCKDQFSLLYGSKNNNHTCLCILVPMSHHALTHSLLKPAEDISLIYKPFHLHMEELLAKRNKKRKEDGEKLMNDLLV
jgi:hypothetical protein